MYFEFVDIFHWKRQITKKIKTQNGHPGRKFSFFKFKGQNFCVYICVRTAGAEFQIPSGTYNDNENPALRNSS